eukprot:8686286-Heterocapsa_arctica.AAC.1
MVSTIGHDNGIHQPTTARKTSGNACRVLSLAAIGVSHSINRSMRILYTFSYSGISSWRSSSSSTRS